jgi:hypothetical protein
MQARAKLGINESTLLLMSMALSYKFDPILLELVSPVLDRFPHVHYHAVGPEEWSQIPEKYNTKQVSIEPSDSEDANSYYWHLAADIHIDSFPFTSLTSALETVREGGVSLSFCPWEKRDDMILCIEPEDYGAPKAILTCPSSGSYTAKLVELISNPALLDSLKVYGKDSMRKHDGFEWTRSMTEVYNKILAVDRRKHFITNKHFLFGSVPIVRTEAPTPSPTPVPVEDVALTALGGSDQCIPLALTRHFNRNETSRAVYSKLYGGMLEK